MKVAAIKHLPFQESYQNLKRRLFDAKSLVLSEQLPYEMIGDYDKAQIRYYARQGTHQRIPLVLVAPLAVKMSIYDLYPYRSLVRHLTEQGFDVYLIDWGQLSRQDADLDFEYFIFQALPALIQRIKTHAKSDEISLQGWSMSGIFCLLYAASGIDQGIRNLLIFGSPADAYASGTIGKAFKLTHDSLEYLASKMKHKFSLSHVPNQVIHTSGFINALGFKLLNPIGILQSQWQLLKRIHLIEDVMAHTTLNDFLNNMVDYPGAINRDMLLWIWLKNPIVQGEFQYGQHHIDLKRIKSALMVGAGATDSMVTADAVRPLTTLTASKDVDFQLIPGGHMGLICSKQSSIEFWPKLTQWLEQRSHL